MCDHEELERDERVITLRPEMCQSLPYLGNDLEVMTDDIIKRTHVQLHNHV